MLTSVLTQATQPQKMSLRKDGNIFMLCDNPVRSEFVLITNFKFRFLG